MLFDRRRMLIAGGATFLSSIAFRESLARNAGRPVFGGWLPDDASDASKRFIKSSPQPYLRDQNRSIRGDGQNKQISLIPYYERVTGRRFTPFYQRIGDCCGQAGTLGAQMLSATQIALHRRNEEWRGEFSVEFTYAASRVEIGGSRIRRGDGSTGAWTAETLHRIGLLLRGKYGSLDLTQYRPDLGRYWGRPGVGVPDELEAVAKDHTVKTVALVTSWKEACDCIANGYPVLLCSSVGYTLRTDSDGFLRRGRDPWYHAMLLVGIDTVSRRQGGLIANSWGPDWYYRDFEHPLGTPSGCFWADAANIEAALLQGDSFALSNFIGFPHRNLDYLLY